ncbi:MAG: hypothetical protein HUJ77_05170 [Clostridium sp.]|uniref:hypothetical protein n=1 Tax=Clostridium sp. TaxID=1506 RepID=UPI0025BC6000|nr:hypothetical protein [Clostridium sp.]MCF0147774.1 hypothetical protein [Clostridium sp.]
MIALLNPASLILGLISWILPIINITKYNKSKQRNWTALSVISLSLCSISILFQIIYTNYLINISDWSALMDTTNAVVFASLILIIVTITLNLITLFMYRNEYQSARRG